MMRFTLAIVGFVIVLTACLSTGECTVDEDCSGGDVCSAGQCVECEADGDCADGESCTDNSCEALVGDGDPVGTGCQSDGDCPAGQTCNLANGVCGAGLDAPQACCFAADGVTEAFECPDPGSIPQCEKLGPESAGCTLNADLDAACRAN